MKTVESHVCHAFLAALMLTGTIEAAESAVSDAIATLECRDDLDELLVRTARSAALFWDERLLQVKTPSGLPSELQHLFLLPCVSRRCFVLRMLMGLSAEMSSEILTVERREVDEVLCRALKDLPRLAGMQSTPERCSY
jgi:DNA-directed RNA polymerase specialized sigma24 family protein